jgi:hypothetical protein
MENYNDSDTSSESEYKSDQESAPGSNYDEDEPNKNLEPELSATIHHDDGIDYSPCTIEAELQAQHNATLLAQLHADIKARACNLITSLLCCINLFYQ